MVQVKEEAHLKTTGGGDVVDEVGIQQAPKKHGEELALEIVQDGEEEQADER